jgi:hypothetical protein
MLSAHEPVAERRCSCRAWDSLSQPSRHLLLADLTEWAKLLHEVQLVLVLREERVAICELRALRPDRRESRRVLSELCSWADCAGVVLELMPPERWGSDVQGPRSLCVSFGFEPSDGSIVRYPIPGQCHIRL